VAQHDNDFFDPGAAGASPRVSQVDDIVLEMPGGMGAMDTNAPPSVPQVVSRPIDLHASLAFAVGAQLSKCESKAPPLVCLDLRTLPHRAAAVSCVAQAVHMCARIMLTFCVDSIDSL
jgi:hypothetical protein